MARTFWFVSLLLCVGLGAMSQPAAAQSGPTCPIVDTAGNTVWEYNYASLQFISGGKFL